MEVTPQELYDIARKLLSKNESERMDRSDLYSLQQNLSEFIAMVITECRK